MRVYDFDKTIYDGDSTVDFIRFCVTKKPMLFLKLVPGLFAFGGYLARLCTKTFFKEKFYRIFTGIPDADTWIEEFWDTHADNIKDWYIVQKQEDDVIISGSPEFLLNPICAKLGISHLIASRVDKQTGMYFGKNCDGEEKVRRFRKEYGNQKIEEFYSDSLSDAPLANIAEKAYLVKGDDIFPWE